MNAPTCPMCHSAGKPWPVRQWFECAKCKMRFLNPGAKWAKPDPFLEAIAIPERKVK